MSKTDVLNLLNQIDATLHSSIQSAIFGVNGLQDPVVPPPPPPPPPPTGVIKALAGSNFQVGDVVKKLRYVECWMFDNTDPVTMCNGVRSLGANAISVLTVTQNLTKLEALCVAAKNASLVFMLDPDQGGQRNWLLNNAVVTLLKKYENNLMLNLETELDKTQEGWTAAGWVADRNIMVNALRVVGYKCPIRIGNPNGGRAPFFALQSGGQVLGSDPERNLFFAGQIYWGTGYYQGLAGVASGNTGRLQILDKFVASNLCFLPGFDFTDDVGDTGEASMADYAQKIGCSYGHWEGVDPDSSDDDLFADHSYAKLTSLGSQMKARWVAENH